MRGKKKLTTYLPNCGLKKKLYLELLHSCTLRFDSFCCKLTLQMNTCAGKKIIPDADRALFTHKNDDFGALSVTSEAAPLLTSKWRVTYRIGVHTIQCFHCHAIKNNIQI